MRKEYCERRDGLGDGHRADETACEVGRGGRHGEEKHSTLIFKT